MPSLNTPFPSPLCNPPPLPSHTALKAAVSQQCPSPSYLPSMRACIKTPMFHKVRVPRPGLIPSVTQSHQ